MKISFEKFLTKYVSEEWLFLLKSYATVESCAKNKRLLNEGDEVKGVYFINSGKIKVFSSFNENELLLRLSTTGDFVGHRAIFSPVYPISAVALTDAVVTFIPIEIFKKLIKNNPNLSFFIIEFLIKDLKNTEEHMRSMIQDDVVIRIGMIICMLIDAFGYDEKTPKKLLYTLSRSDMASFAGTTYESVIRNLAKLEEMKIIQLEKKMIHVLSERNLRKLVESKKV